MQCEEEVQIRITLGNRRGRRPSAATVLSAVGRYIRQNTVIGVRGTRRRKIQCGCTGEGYGGELCQCDAGYRRSATGKDRSFVDDNLVGGWVMFEELPGISVEDCLFADLGVDPIGGCQSYEA